MTRPNIHQMRSSIAAINIGKAGLGADQKNKRRVLRNTAEITGDMTLMSVLHEQDKLEAQYKAACEHASPRRTPRANASRKPGGRKDYRSPEGFNECGLEVGRSYANRAGARMEAKKAGFPDVMRHPTTINLCIVPVWGCLKLAADLQRQKLRCKLVGFSFGVQIEGMFSYVMKTAAYLQTMFPIDEWPDGFDPVNRPDELFALFHIHCDISDPFLTKRQVRDIVVDAFPGSHRVCVRKVQPEEETEDGERTRGGQGYLEYAAMDKVEIKFDTAKQREEATIAHARLSKTWTKRNKSFSMGKSLSVTGAKIDQDRVVELLLIERLEWIKKNKDGEAYAEWFLHVWRSGMIKVIQKPNKWVKLGLITGDRFLQALALVKNWCADDRPEAPCFFDYADALLE